MKTISLRPLLVLFAAAAGLLLLGSNCKLANKAPAIPTLTGPTTGVAGVAVTFTAAATDPESDSLQFLFDWGDGATPVWTAFVASGDTVTATNTYSDSGTFTVKARSKDPNGKESNWSAGQTLAISDAGAGYPDSVFGSITVGIRAVGGMITPDGRFLYVVHDGYDFVTPIRLADRTVLPIVTVGPNPYSLAATPDGQYVYVACDETTAVWVIRTSDNAVVSRIEVGHTPRGIAVSPDGTRAFVALWQDSKLVAIRTSDNSVIDSLLLSAQPRRLAVDPNGAYVYVLFPSTGHVGIVSTSSFALVDSAETGLLPAIACCSPSGNRLYVTNQTDSGIVAINTSTRQPEAHYNLHDPRVSGVAVTSDGRCVLAVNWFGLHTISATSGAVLDSLPYGAGGDVALAPSGDSLYVFSNDKVYIVGRR